MLATECSECSAVLLFRHNLCFSLKALKTLGNQHCDGLKTPQVNSSYVQLLVGNGFERSTSDKRFFLQINSFHEFKSLTI